MGCRLLLLLGCCFFARVLADLSPHHVYLSLNGESDSIQVTFTTSSYPTAPCLQYWSVESTDSVTNYILGNDNNILTFANPNANATDYITSLSITNLARDTNYGYIVFGDCKNSSTCTEELNFKSLPEDDDVFNIGFYGDLGSNGQALLEQGPGGLLSYSSNFDLIVHNGDLAYNLGSDNGTNGNLFLTRIAPITSQIPYLVTPGNHEFHGPTDPIYYNNWFWGQSLLGNRSGSLSPVMWYSYDPNPSIHIIAISTEVYCEDPDNLVDQYNWLVDDLEEVNKRNPRPWIIMFGHRQMYYGVKNDYHSRLMRLGVQCSDSTLEKCDHFSACESGENCAYGLEALLGEYSVDMLLAGHKHTYSRMFPISSNLTYENQDDNVYLNPQNPVYIISGGAGTQSGKDNSSSDDDFVFSKKDHTPIVGSSTDFTFSHMRVFNLTHIYIEQINSANAKVVDYVWIIKDPTQPPCEDFKAFELGKPKETECN